jgi:hypothetical protein
MTMGPSIRCSSALWSAVPVVGLSHASTSDPLVMAACPVMTTLASVPPGCAPKSIRVVPAGMVRASRCRRRSP